MGSLAGITQILSPILTMTGLPGAMVGMGTNYVEQNKMRDELRRQQDNTLAQLKARQGLDEASAAQNAATEKARLAQEAGIAETRRLSALRRSVARQKTLFSAQGLGAGTDGSNEAVLLGLYRDSAAEGDADARLSALRNTTIDQNLAQQRQRNLLESAQLAERQRLSRILQGY